MTDKLNAAAPEEPRRDTSETRDETGRAREQGIANDPDADEQDIEADEDEQDVLDEEEIDDDEMEDVETEEVETEEEAAR